MNNLDLQERLEYYLNRIYEGEYYWGSIFNNPVEVLFLNANEKFKGNELYNFWKSNSKCLRFLINKKGQIVLGDAYKLEHLDLNDILIKNGISSNFLNKDGSYNDCIPGFINDQFKIELDDNYKINWNYVNVEDNKEVNSILSQLKNSIKEIIVVKNRLGLTLDPIQKRDLSKSLKEISNLKNKRGLK